MSDNLSNEEKARLYDEIQKKERLAASAKEVKINWFWFAVVGILITIAIIYLFKPDSSYIKKYSGVYNIGQDAVESYDLKDDGSCTWTWTSSTGDSQVKDGSWSAKEGYISVTINRNAGDVVEEYFWTDGKFVTRENSDRFLVKK